MAQAKTRERPDLRIEYLATSALTPDPANARRHKSKQITKLAAIMSELGFSSPIVIDETGRVLAGHARLLAAKLLGMLTVPCIRLTYLSPAQKKALALADNKMSDESDFDDTLVRSILLELTDLDFNVELTGFDTGEIDFRIDGVAGSTSEDPADSYDEPTDQPAVSQRGDLWLLGRHRLLCGTALEGSSYGQLLSADRAQLIFSDPPYNVRIDGHVSGLGRRRHREFAMAAGEMSDAEFLTFLATAIDQMANFSTDGSIHFLCIDWRHIGTMLEAGKSQYTPLNICVWNKTNAGMGSLYRSQHELICVFKKGSAPHQNNVQLGKYGRWRSNVWTYPGANAFGATRDADLADHPTVKPTALVADAIRDCSKRGAIVLDPFVGSGTTILAAERTGRRAAAIEIDPLYVDTAVRRWQAMTGQSAVLAGDGRTFGQVTADRLASAALAASSAEEG